MHAGRRHYLGADRNAIHLVPIGRGEKLLSCVPIGMDVFFGEKRLHACHAPRGWFRNAIGAVNLLRMSNMSANMGVL